VRALLFSDTGEGDGLTAALFLDGQLFVRIEDRDWVPDAAAPNSFGEPSGLTLGGQVFRSTEAIAS
jgi:hypothetical protein